MAARNARWPPARRRAPAPCGHVRGRVPSEALLGRLGGLPVGSLHHCNTCGRGTRREHLAGVPCANRAASLCSHTGRARGLIRPRTPPRSLLAERGCVPRRSSRTRQEALRVCGGSQLAQPARGVPEQSLNRRSPRYSGTGSTASTRAGRRRLHRRGAMSGQARQNCLACRACSPPHRLPV